MTPSELLRAVIADNRAHYPEDLWPGIDVREFPPELWSAFERQAAQAIRRCCDNILAEYEAREGEIDE